MGMRTEPEGERQQSGRGSQRRGRAGSQLTEVDSPFPVEDGVPAHPRWFHRLRGVAGLAVLLTIMGVLTAIAVAVLLVLLIVVAVSTIA
jgi:hypothetical protein